MTKRPDSFSALITVYITAFLDLLGVGIVVPVLAPLFLDLHNGLFPASFSFHERSITLGILIAAYPFAQFFGAPFFGALSDRWGRKKVLVLSLCGTTLGYLLFGSGILMKNLWVLFISRLIDGFTGGSTSTVNSTIADVSDETTRPRNFGLVGMMFGLGFILGPFIGGVLSDSHIVWWFGYVVPFWFCALLSFINVISVSLFFKETLHHKVDSKLTLFSGITNLQNAFKLQNLRTIFLVIFLSYFGFNLFVQFFPVYLIRKFELNQSEIGFLFAYVGIWIAITQGGIIRIVSKKFTPQKILPITLLGLAISFIVLLFPSRRLDLYIILPLIAVFQGLIQPMSTSMLSGMADEKSQGEVMGVNQSIQAIGFMIPPIIDGFLTSLNIAFPIIAGSICTLLAWLVFDFFFNAHRWGKFKEV
ncbi:MAG TPA: MFS transporter [Candidatus Saccharimonadales bacterium]|nr:MFS transporter [Candidatus Saccharimonadales bacterium]